MRHEKHWEFYTNPLSRTYTPNPSDFDKVTGEGYQLQTETELEWMERGEVPETIENGPDWLPMNVYNYEPKDMEEYINDVRNFTEVAWRMLIEAHAQIERTHATPKRPARSSELFAAYLAQNAGLI